MNGREQEIYTFHNFQLDIGKGVLLREGEQVSLQWKAFETLCVLVKSRGQLVTRDELIDEIWPDAFVEENNLSQHIRSIRKALGDGEDGNKFIETVPRRGFRFLPGVQKLDNPDDRSLAIADKGHIAAIRENEIINDGQTRAPMIVRRRSRMWPKLVSLAAVAAIALAALMLWSKWESPTERRIHYANQIRLAAQAWEASNLPLLKELLDETKPKASEEDLRGFEWGYLSRLYSDSIASQPLILKHESSIDSVAFSPDGKTLATASRDNTVRLWDVATGQQIKAFAGHTNWVISVAFSPDGTKLVTGSFDKTAKMWDIASSRELFTITAENNAIGGLTFSPDGKTLAGDDAGKIKFWDPSSGVERTGYFKPRDAHAPIALSPDGKLFAARASDQAAVVWEIGTGSKIATLDGHFGLLTDIKFPPDSRSLLTAGTDGIVKLWNLQTGNESRKLTGHSEIYDVAFSPDGKTVATGDDDTIKVWNVENGIEIETLKGHLDDVHAIAFSPDGSRLASGGADDTARIWNVPKNESRGVLRGHSKGVGSLIFSPDGKTLASASEDKSAKLWDVDSERERLTLSGHTDRVYSAAFSPDGLTLATGSEDRKIKLWDVARGRERLSIDSPKPATVLTFSPDGKILATGHWWHDPEVRLWDATSGTLACSVDAGNAGAWSVVFSKDGKQLATSAPEDNVIRLWETGSCREVSAFKGEPDTAYGSAFFAPNGKLLALQILNNGRSLKLLDPENGRELATFSGHETEMADADFSPDGNRLVTSSRDGVIKIWDVATGQELLSIKGSLKEINSTAFSPDGAILAAAGDDGTIRLWRGTNN